MDGYQHRRPTLYVMQKWTESTFGCAIKWIPISGVLICLSADTRKTQENQLLNELSATLTPHLIEKHGAHHCIVVAHELLSRFCLEVSHICVLYFKTVLLFSYIKSQTVSVVVCITVCDSNLFTCATFSICWSYTVLLCERGWQHALFDNPFSIRSHNLKNSLSLHLSHKTP